MRHGQGWRGRWWEDGRQRVTKTVETKDEASELLERELLRVRRPDEYRRRMRAELTLEQLTDRWLDQHEAKPITIHTLRIALVRPIRAFGDRPAASITTEELQRWLVKQTTGRPEAPRPLTLAYRHAIIAAVRGAYNFGQRVGLLDENPARLVRAPQPQRGENIIPFQDWGEVERLAEEAGRWGPMIMFAVDTGARPGEIRTLEHNHVDGDRVFLPGTKTDGSRRVVHITRRGHEALAAFPRALSTPLVFHDHGEPLNWNTWQKRVWHPALEQAGLAKRAPYCMRHTFAFFSLRAGVPVADVAREMGHTSVSRTYVTYGMWIDELGERAARLRDQWADSETRERERR